MASFKDQNGKQWTIALDAPTIRAVRAECDGLDLADLEGKSFAKLVDDPCLLVDVLWILCRKQAETAKISDELFGASLVGDAIDAATNAMLESIADFFPHKKRELLKLIVKKSESLRNGAMADAMERLNNPELERKLLAGMKHKIESDIEKVLTRFNSATSTQDS